MSKSDDEQFHDLVHARIVGQADDGGAAFGGAYDTVMFSTSSGGRPPETLEFRARGMSLRDYFAGQALAAGYRADNYDMKGTATTCYEIADAMLAVRRKGTPS